MYISLLIAGFGGGAVRGLIGFMKHQYSYKNTGFNLPYFFAMAFLSGIVGVLVAAAVNNAGFSIGDIIYVSPGLAFIIGYAGGDFLEGLYKVIVSNTSLKGKQ
ncbi:MAG: hypothetical protein WC397_04435 [Candidatus Paceibacterota bacterium]|jgi:hypothetical protein